MAIGDVPLTPIIDPITGTVTEIGRIFLRTLTSAVGALAPTDAMYWVSQSASILTADVNLGALPSGYLLIDAAVGTATPRTVTTIPLGDVTGLAAALALKAPIASPALTGTPTAPTAAPGTNTTQIATTAFAHGEASAAIVGLAPLASPAFTGTPTAPTAAGATNTTQLATTAMVQAALVPTAKLAGGNTFTGNQTINAVLLLNTATTFGVPSIMVAADGAVRNGITLQNTNPANTFFYALFYNSAGAQAGSIVQSGATGVLYNTASDARLKDDAGRATDLAALRAVVVHDFAWTSDGRTDRGVFAQEAHAVFPRAVSPGTDETTADGSLARPWMTDYSKFVPDLIVGWQQHDAAIAAIADLRAELAALRARLEQGGSNGAL